MSNGMPSWDEWNNQLSEEQRQYSLYKILESLNNRLAQQPETCEQRFKRLERRKKWNTVESLSGGIIGGILAVIGGWAFWRGPP